MSTERPRNRALLLSWLAITVLLAAPDALATTTGTAPSTGWSIRFFAASIDFDNHADGYRSRTGSDYDIDLGFGLGLAAEYRFSRRLGLDLGILGGAAVDVAWSTVELGEWVWAGYDTLTFTPLSAGLDIHLTPDKDVDLYVCPLLAWVHYGGLVVHSGPDWTVTTIDFDHDIGIGGNLGLTVPLGDRRRWTFNANLIYLESNLESRRWEEGRLAGDYAATILGIGAGYRF